MSFRNRNADPAAPLDAADARILRALAEDARLSNAELARRIGLSAPTIAERVRRLKDRGVITGYAIQIDPGKLGYALSVMIRARPLPGEMTNMIKAIQDTPEIVQCDRVSGDDCFVAIAHVRDVGQLEAVIDRLVPFGATNTAIIQSAAVAPRLPNLDEEP